MWFVVRSQIKSEDKAEQSLRRAGFTVYSPLARIERFNRRKKVHVQIVLRLMPRYLFIQIDGDVPWFTIRACDGVESILGSAGRPCRLHGDDARKLQAVIEAEADLQFDSTREAMVRRGEIGKNRRETTRMKYPPGSSIRITDGPFSQFIAQVTNVTGKGKLEALVTVFGRLSPIEIPEAWAELDETAAAA